MAYLCLLRHGESLWNRENRFTGWVDVPLTEHGMEEAKAAGSKLRESGTAYHVAYTSVLSRAVGTLEIVLREMNADIPVIRDEHLNERNYGDLQGLNKAGAAAVYGDEQVKRWRRSYSVRPMNGESFEDTQKRTIPFFRNCILTDINSGKNVLVVAHGNSLRSIVMYLEKIPAEVIPGIEIQTGVPLVYEVDGENTVRGKTELK
ncbi:MAG: 2,3-diphosphoglycerate-dependent phosphoglycerate mutase [Thermoplasmata archaeon]|nr:2,3-diphosphoglycerate-dependent phosphoglycerate mutase [Candidatus Sysuiplasma jiujiangense]